MSSTGEGKPSESGAGGSAARGTGQRTSDVRDAMAEMAERAQLISQEAGTKIAAAMKDVIGAAAGLAGFAVESARDLAQFMVRRGQITQDEADKLIREAEDAHAKRSGRTGAKTAPAVAKPEKKAPAKRAAVAKKSTAKQSSAKKKR